MNFASFTICPLSSPTTFGDHGSENRANFSSRLTLSSIEVIRFPGGLGEGILPPRRAGGLREADLSRAINHRDHRGHREVRSAAATPGSAGAVLGDLCVLCVACLAKPTSRTSPALLRGKRSCRETRSEKKESQLICS